MLDCNRPRPPAVTTGKSGCLITSRRNAELEAANYELTQRLDNAEWVIADALAWLATARGITSMDQSERDKITDDEIARRFDANLDRHIKATDAAQSQTTVCPVHHTPIGTCGCTPSQDQHVSSDTTNQPSFDPLNPTPEEEADMVAGYCDGVAKRSGWRDSIAYAWGRGSALRDRGDQPDEQRREVERRVAERMRHGR